MSLENKTIFITGASRGIGKAIALCLAEERPAHIVVGYCSNHRAAREVLTQIEACGVAASPLSGDIAKPELITEMFHEIKNRLGHLDIFVNNAARTTFRPVMDLNPRNLRHIMDINVQSFLLCAQQAAELMREHGGGRIVGISSLGSQYYIPRYAGLGMAKASIEALIRYMAVEFAPWGINVNGVSGGFIDTDSMKLAPEYNQMVAYNLERTPARRLGEPADLAKVVKFLCSPESEWIRGQTIIADGGFSLIL